MKGKARHQDQPRVFVKHRVGAPRSAYEFEAAGLNWLAEAESGCPVPRIIALESDRLLVQYIPEVSPSTPAARNFGAQLARTHAAGAERFGSLPPPVNRAFIASIPLPSGEWETFGSFYAQARLRPLGRIAADRHAITEDDERSLRDLCDALETEDPRLIGPPDGVARVHGDLWSGNVRWSRRGCVLIDPCAHGGHRESDLAMLALFGLAFLDEVLDAYHEEWPLNEGWKTRVPLHQLYPLLVHAILFGGSYPTAVARVTRDVLERVNL